MNLIRGSSSGLVRQANRFFGVYGAYSNEGDQAGFSLAAGDFDGDGLTDLALGAPGRDTSSTEDSGAVVVMRSVLGSGPDPYQFRQRRQSSAGGAVETDDQLGFAVAARDFDCDGRDDVAVSTVAEAIGSEIYAGAVSVFPGASELIDSGETWFQNSAGIIGDSEVGDQFGASLATGRLGGDCASLAIGVVGEAVAGTSFAGAVQLIHSDASLFSDGFETGDLGAWGSRRRSVHVAFIWRPLISARNSDLTPTERQMSPQPTSSVFRLLSCLVTLLLASVGSAGALAVWQPLGPFGGAVAAVAYDPGDGAEVWVAGDGGVFHSADGGVSWTPTGSGLEGLAPTLVQVDPASSTTIWVGTDASGLHRSTNGGGVWLPTGLASGAVRSLVRDPTDPLKAWVGTDSGGQRSLDGGASWSPLGGGLPSDAILALVRGADGALWAGTDAGEVYLSPDGGATWNLRDTDLPGSAVVGLVAHPGSASVLWAALDGDGVWTSIDAGASWDAAVTGLTDPTLLGLAGAPSDASILYAVSEASGLFASGDGGASWSPVVGGLTSTVLTAVAISPDTATRVLAASEDAGIFRSQDSGSTWVESNQGLALAPIDAIAEGVGSTLYGASRGLGVFRSPDDGATWDLVNAGLASPKVVDVVASPSVAGLAWAATDGGGVHRTEDGGTSWTPVGPSNPDVLAVELGADGFLWAATDGSGVFRSDDGGATWDPASTGLTDLRVEALSVDPADADRAFASTRDGLFKTANGGQAWSLSNTGLELVAVAALAFGSPTWAATDGGVFVSDDGGSSWSQTIGAPSDPVTTAVALDGDGLPWVGTEIAGVFQSKDGGDSWIPSGAGVASPTVAALYLDSESRLLMGTTQGVYAREPPLFEDGFESGDTSAW